MYKRLSKEQLAQIIHAEINQSKGDKKRLRQELCQEIKLKKAISKKWDIIGALWEYQVIELEKQLAKI